MRCLHSALCTLHFALLLLPTALCPLSSSAQDDPFALGVRTTPWLKPQEEQKKFKLPEGFEINLVAAEPDIQKPLNMQFDEKGRIWLTCSVEYPYAAPLDKPARDSIRVLEDTDGDGRFEKVTVFADGLNIPIGIYPWKGGCIAWSIPNIWHFEDTDGDLKCDKRTILYGPFDHTRDVHGNCNAFRRGFDGWVYACHGFNNDSHVKGTDGHEVHLNSGNTFRFQLDGSRIEHFTHGQVNPFGMCFDELFNIFTADCHSKPLTQLIRGGHYPSFGKPHDGLGFVPSMMEHSHGSTAICGVVCYSGENFPQEYRGNF
ncbi:MAG: dehydrogenase, partial [Pirellulaceae bacterium]|nr:dehydrogenase [Pirellulaceae bacterium]